MSGSPQRRRCGGGLFRIARIIHDGIVADCATLAAASKLPGGTPSDAVIWGLARAGAIGNPSGSYCVLTQPSTSLTLSVALKGYGLCAVNWGDGTAIQSIALNPTNAATVARTWGVGANMTVMVAGKITSFANSTGAIGGIVSGLRSTLTYVYLIGSNTCSGSIAGLTLLTSLTLGGSNTCSGSITGLTLLTYLTLTGSNTCSGSVAGLTLLTNLYLGGYNTCSGSVAGLTLLTSLSLTGSNTCTGSVAGLTLLTSLSLTGSNTCSGSIAGLTLLTNLTLTGPNTCTGSVAGLTLLTNLYLAGLTPVQVPSLD